MSTTACNRVAHPTSHSFSAEGLLPEALRDHLTTCVMAYQYE